MKNKSVLFLFIFALFSMNGWTEQILRLGTEGNHFPFNERASNGQLSGFEIDLMNGFCESTGYKCSYKIKSFKDLFSGLKSNTLDAIFSCISITAKRREEMDFSIPYLVYENAFIRKMGTSYEVAKLKNKDKVAVKRNSRSRQYMEKKWPKVKLLIVEDSEDILLAILGNRAKMAFVSTLDDRNVFSDKELEVVGDYIQDSEILGEGCGIAIKKGSKDLKSALDNYITKKKSDGSIRKWKEKYGIKGQGKG